MSLKLHFKSRMFLTNPYVVRVTHPDSTLGNMNLAEFIKFRKIAREQIKSTWGYSDPVIETIKTEAEEVVLFGSLTYMLPLQECHSYWVFTDEADALQFRLTAGESIQMHMWPTNIKFTIYEYVD